MGLSNVSSDDYKGMFHQKQETKSNMPSFCHFPVRMVAWALPWDREVCSLFLGIPELRIPDDNQPTGSQENWEEGFQQTPGEVTSSHVKMV